MARYVPDDPAFAGDFVEYSDSWSRAQVRQAWESIPAAATVGDDDEPLLACLRPKIVGLHLTCVDAPAITDAADLSPARTEQMDMRLYNWFAASWIVHINSLTALGNALGRRLQATSVTAQTTATPTARHRRRKS